MLTLQMILDRIRRRGWRMCEVEAAVRLWCLPPLLDCWHEAKIGNLHLRWFSSGFITCTPLR